MAAVNVDDLPLLQQRAAMHVSEENGIELQGPWAAGQDFSQILSTMTNLIAEQPMTSEYPEISGHTTNKLRLVNLNFSLVDQSVRESLEKLVMTRTWSRVHVVWCSGEIPTSLVQRTRRLEIYGGGPHWQDSSRPLWETLGQTLMQSGSICPLRILRIRSRFNEESMRLLTSGLGSPDSLVEEAHFTCEFVDAGSALALADGLRVNRHLLRLTFFGCEFFDEPTTEQLLLSLQNHPTLSTLELQDNNCFAMPALSSLVEAPTCPLKTLNLYYPAQSTRGVQVPRLDARSMSSALRANKSLKHLILASNALDDESAAWIAAALKVNETLETLDLTGNVIGDEGIEALGAALPYMKGIKELFLSNNDFGGRGARALAEGMKTNVVCENIVTFNKFYACRQLEFYIHLNQAGRRIFRHENANSIPLSLWPVLLARTNQRFCTDWDKSETASAIYGLLLEGGHQQLFG